MRRPTRTRVAVAVLVGLVVFLLGSLVHEVKVRDHHIAEQNDKLDRQNRLITDQNSKLDELKTSRESVVTTLSNLLLPAIQRGQEVTVEQILRKAPGLDRQIIEEAIRRAQKTAKGPPGPPGPPGPGGAAAAPPASTSTTTTIRPASTTTSTRSSPSSTTTTTRSCAIDAGRLLRIGC